MNSPECAICNNKFDTDSRRPRSLRCGHGFCTQCIQECIDRGSTSCPVCKEEHGASSATEVRVSFLLEEFLTKASISEPNKENYPVTCSRHKGVPLYFHCKTHSVKVCHSCAVIEHNPSACTLISLEDEIKEKKEMKIVKIQKHKQVLVDSENDINMLLQRIANGLTEQTNEKKCLKKELEMLHSKIQKKNQEIFKTEKLKEKINDIIHNYQAKQKSFEILKNKINSTSDEDIVNLLEMADNEILETQKWDEMSRKELNVVKESVAVETFVQVENDKILRCCRVFKESGKSFLPSLSRNVKPSISAKLIKEDDLGLSSTTTVFMDLSHRGSNLGRILFRVFGDRHYGHQFIMLALGSIGPGFKKAKFESRKNGEWIELRNYVTESGDMLDKPLLSTLKRGNFKKPSRGELYPCAHWNASGKTASFMIMANGQSDGFNGHFGDVITGLDVIDRIVSNAYKSSDITIDECGIVLDY